MTFIDISHGKPSPSLIFGYSVLCVVSLLCAYWAVNIGRSRQHYRSFSVRVLFPIALLILALENAALAASGKIYDNLVETGEDVDSLAIIKAVFVLQTLEVPILLMVIFELTYLVHKRRSVNFCGMYFDEGARVESTAYTGWVLRNSIRALSTILAVLGLMVNFDVIQRNTEVDKLAGTAGWWSLSFDDLDGQLPLLLSLIPELVLIIVAFYLSIMLWRYGTESSMVVHSSICNPWFYAFFGTLAMGIGQLFGELYTFMSNLGVLIFIITILLLMVEVDKDMVATNDIACFLAAVALKGDEMRIIETLPPVTKHPQHEEEKRPEDEENDTAVLTVDVSRENAAIPSEDDENDTAVLTSDVSRENAAIPPEQIKTLNMSEGDGQAEEDQTTPNEKMNCSAGSTNHGEAKKSAVLVENKTKENENGITTPSSQSSEAPYTAEDDTMISSKNADISFTSDEDYNEFLCVIRSKTNTTKESVMNVPVDP